MGKITFTGPSGGDGHERVERGMSGFITAPAENRFPVSLRRLRASREIDEA